MLGRDFRTHGTAAIGRRIGLYAPGEFADHRDGPPCQIEPTPEWFRKTP